MIDRIISGGQTGVDRAALDVALELGLPAGGWCPRGRRAEDGRIDRRYPLRECTSANYAVRTRLNVSDSDGTLILCRGELSGGTALTESAARRQGRPVLVVDLLRNFDFGAVSDWIETHRIRVLNVAGPRESQERGIYQEACGFLRELFHRTISHKD